VRCPVCDARHPAPSTNYRVSRRAPAHLSPQQNGARMKRFFQLLIICLPLLLGYGCWTKSPFYGETYSWHQRIQAEVSTPTGLVTAAVVQGMKITYYPNGLFATGTETDPKLTGEALVVDLGAELGPRRYVFALLPGPGLARSVFHDLRVGRMDTGTFLGLIEDQIGKTPTKIDGLRWVGFEDFSDPKSVFAVDPENLAASYGEGYALTRLTLQISDEPLTRGEVEKVLGWWCEYTQPYKRLSGLSGVISDNQLANRLGPGAFKNGDCI